MADPRESFNERGHAEQARVAEKADRIKERLLERQEQQHPVRLAAETKRLYEKDQPTPRLDMLPRNRDAEIEQKAKTAVAQKEAGERARLERARESEMRKAADGQTQNAEKTQAEARAKAARERMERTLQGHAQALQRRQQRD